MQGSFSASLRNFFFNPTPSAAVRIFDHDVRLTLQYNLDAYLGNQKVLTVTRHSWRRQWNIIDVNDQILMKIKCSGVFTTRCEIKRLVAGTTTTFKKI